jgi:hypothetical protein
MSELRSVRSVVESAEPGAFQMYSGFVHCSVILYFTYWHYYVNYYYLLTLSKDGGGVAER